MVIKAALGVERRDRLALREERQTATKSSSGSPTRYTNSMATYREFHRRSIDDREGFWAEEAKRVHWQRPFQKVLDYSRPPFAWFVGGETNLCYNAVDRHLASRGDQTALVWISTEVDQKTRVSPSRNYPGR